MTKKREKRPAPVSWHPPKDRRDEFFALVEASGLSINAYITQAVFGENAPRAARRQPVERKELVRLHAELVAVRTLFEQLALGSPEDPDLKAAFDQACREHTQFIGAFLEAAGRQP